MAHSLTAWCQACVRTVTKSALTDRRQFAAFRKVDNGKIFASVKRFVFDRGDGSGNIYALDDIVITAMYNGRSPEDVAWAVLQ